MHRVLEIYRFIHYLWIVSQGYKCCYLIVGYLAFRTLACRLRHLFTDSDAELFILLVLMWRVLHLAGELVQTGPELFVMWISIFALFYEDLKSASKQLSDPPEASPKKWKKPCPAFLWEPQILLHTNFPLISWTVRNGKTLVLLWGEREFEWQGPALDFCWIKRGWLSEVWYIKTAICIFAAILKGISCSQWSTTNRGKRTAWFNITNDTQGVTP